MDDDATLVPSPLQAGSISSSARSGSRGNGIIHVNRPRLPPHKKVERSCILCHRRKIKCDKKSPCSTCTKTGVLCCYPASEQPTARRPRKTTIADVAERLVRLERTLVAISTTTAGEGGSSGADADGAGETPGEGGGSGEGRKEGGGGGKGEGESPSVLEEFLLQNGDSSRYMNEILISRVLEEEDELRSVLGAQETVKPDLSHEIDGDRFQPLDLGGLLSGYSPPCVNSLDMHPSKWQAMQLWQVFVSYVDMMNKVLHIPTTEIVVFKAIDDPLSAPADVNCLLFSVYFSAVTAMEDDAVVALLAKSKRRALSNFRRGLEVSLVQADFLEAPTLTSLQAMGIFLQTIRAHNTGRSVWVLCGLVLRAAQSMGLHRDGKLLGLPVFETELRRRLWWCITANDGRVAEDHSINVNSHDPSTNIEFPSNVDDGQLYPGMTEFPQVRGGRWSEMSLPLVMKEHCLARRKLYQAAPPLSATLPPESVRREIVDGVMRHCEETYFRYCNPVVPAQRAAMLIGRAALAKLDFVSRLQWASMANQNTTRGLLATDETLDEACGIIEYGTQLVTDELLRNYRWISDVYPQYHVVLYVLWRLCVRPTGRHVERAWEAVEISFRIEFGRIGFENSPPGSKWTVLKAFRERAMKIRDMVAEGKGPVDGAAEGQNGEQTDVTRDTMAVTEEIGNGFAWNLQDADLPDWNDLVEDFKLDGYDIQI